MIHTDGKPTIANATGGGAKRPPSRPRPGETPADQIGREAGELLKREAEREARDR